jgi:hypothetical protein
LSANSKTVKQTVPCTRAEAVRLAKVTTDVLRMRSGMTSERQSQLQERRKEIMPAKKYDEYSRSNFFGASQKHVFSQQEHERLVKNSETLTRISVNKVKLI